MDLLGTSTCKNLQELKRRYYDLALLCHPDRGGTAEDMRVIQQTYEKARDAFVHQMDADEKRRHIESQLSSVENEEGEVDLPSFRSIFDDVHDHFNEKFNERFEAQCHEHDMDTQGMFSRNPFAQQGYGEYMIMRSAVDESVTVSDHSLVYDPTDIFDPNSQAKLKDLKTMYSDPISNLNTENKTKDTSNTNHDKAKDVKDTQIIVHSQQSTTGAWTRDAHSTQWNKNTRIQDFGSATTVPDEIPLTDYRLGFEPLVKGKPKTWLQSHLPSLREETLQDLIDESDEQLDDPANYLPWEYQTDGGGNTLHLRRRRGMKPSVSEWTIEFQQDDGKVDMSSNAKKTRKAIVNPFVVDGILPSGEHANKSLLAQLSDNLQDLWRQWLGSKSDEELLPSVVRFMNTAPYEESSLEIEIIDNSKCKLD